MTLAFVFALFFGVGYLIFRIGDKKKRYEEELHSAGATVMILMGIAFCVRVCILAASFP